MYFITLSLSLKSKCQPPLESVEAQISEGIDKLSLELSLKCLSDQLLFLIT